MVLQQLSESAPHAKKILTNVLTNDLRAIKENHRQRLTPTMTKYSATVQGLVMNLLRMEEARVESTELPLPVGLTGDQDDGAGAVSFYFTTENSRRRRA